MTATPTILLAEDNPADVFLVQEAFREHDLTVDLHVATNGESAIRFIEAAEEGDGEPGPVMALLDLNLPRKSGLEVLERLRMSAKYGNIPVAIISSSRLPRDEMAAARLGANRFFTKPSDYFQFMALGELVKELLRGTKFNCTAA